MKLLRLTALLVMTAIAGFAMSCDGNASEIKNEEETVKPGDPIATVDGKVRFYIDVDDSAPRLAAGISRKDVLSSASSVYVNDEKYPLQTDDTGNIYAEVSENASGTYTAALTMDKGTGWFGASPDEEIRIPSAQFPDGQSASSVSFANYPMYGSYVEASGNVLYMSDLTGVLNISLKGSARIASVKLSCEGSQMSGVFRKTGGSLAPVGTSADHVVLNCVNAGRFMPADNVFSLFVAPGAYRNAEIVICDSEHRVMRTGIDLNIGSGMVVTKELEWAPDGGVLWYEGFDLCAWGGNIMGGAAASGLSPAGGETGIDSGRELSGTEYALAQVAYNVAGSGYVQPDAWNSVSGKTVGTARQMSDKYVKNRNFSDWRYIYRTREFPGMLAVAYDVVTRGIVATPSFSNIKGIRKIRISVKFCALAGFNDDLLASVNSGGVIASASLDGAPLAFKSLSYAGVSGGALIANGSVTVPATMSNPQKWQTLELVVDRASDATYLQLCGNTTSAGNHGFMIDEIKVEDLGEDVKKGTLRVLYWNIQNGMWSDQADGYADFIAWVKRYDPDICVWCEAASIYKDNSKTTASDAERRLPAGWSEVAAKYGHKYVATGGWRDNYPQEITSRYPIETLLKITDTDVSGKPVAHGAAVQQVDVNGRKINVVTLHTWPQAYGYGVATADREASAARNEGDLYREFEVKYVLSHTVNAAEFGDCRDWLMMGDFNARSYYDDWYYKHGESSSKYLCQNAVRDHSDMVDIISAAYPGYFMSTTAGNSRIDYMFASPSMYSRVKNAMVVVDSYASPVLDADFGTGFYNPSDHRPILVDFEF